MSLRCEVCGRFIAKDSARTDESGDYCIPCAEAIWRQGALDAGIPLSVIEGKTKLSDHFSEAYIESQCAPKGRPL